MAPVGWRLPSSVGVPRPSACSAREQAEAVIELTARSGPDRGAGSAPRRARWQAGFRRAAGRSRRRQRVPAPSRDSVGLARAAPGPRRDGTPQTRYSIAPSNSSIDRSVKRRRPPCHLARNTEQLPTCREHGGRGIGGRSTPATSSAQSPMRCSQLSSTSSDGSSPSAAAILRDDRSGLMVVRVHPGRRAPPAPHHRSTVTAASSTHHTPPRETGVPAMPRRRRGQAGVLPTPPGPLLMRDEALDTDEPRTTSSMPARATRSDGVSCVGRLWRRAVQDQ